MAPQLAARKVNVALLGYGAVGAAVDRHLRRHGDEIARATGLRLRVAHALVRDLGKRRQIAPRDGVLTTDFDEIRDDDAVVAVAELMGGLDPTHGYIEALLARGKGITTANKQLLAGCGQPLLGRVRAGGSVAGALPVFAVLRDGLPPGSCTRITGVVNGTTNFLLRRVEDGASFADALDDATKLGIAEQDPTEDLTGADAAAKMAILASVAFGRPVTLDEVAYEGIEGLDEERVRAHRTRGRAVRLVGTATRERVEVRLTELDAAHPFAALEGVENAVTIEGSGFRRITLTGPGAGGRATAAAVVADLVELVR
jgi:homoserine dehydrogenase